MEVPKDLAEAVAFHGHLCPGLVIGYLAATVGLERLGADRSEDEELIAIVENDSCAVDAVQWLTGCTFGKGNLFFLDHGKQVFTFAARASGRAVRVSLRPEESRPEPDPSLSEAERRGRRIEHMLAQSGDALFAVTEETIDLPEYARIYSSVICAECGEKVMETRTETSAGKRLCIPCAEKVRRRA